MSCREVEGDWPLESGNCNRSNVVRLQTGAGGGRRGGAAAVRELPEPAPETITRDGLDLLRAFFAIGDAPSRAALLLMAQRLAGQPGKR